MFETAELMAPSSGLRECVGLCSQCILTCPHRMLLELCFTLRHGSAGNPLSTAISALMISLEFARLRNRQVRGLRPLRMWLPIGTPTRLFSQATLEVFAQKFSHPLVLSWCRPILSNVRAN